MRKDKRNEKVSKRRPPKALYCPPQMRHSTPTQHPATTTPTQQEDTSQSREVVSPCKHFNLEVEVQPEFWWRGVVQCGQEARLVQQIQKQYKLSPQLSDALLDMMLEFVTTKC